MGAIRSTAVVLADIVDSSTIAELRRVRDDSLASLSREHLDAGLVLARYTVTAWDEFQNVLTRRWDLPRVVWDLRLAFAPFELRIGLGIGGVEELPGPDTPINEASSGEAFVLAREAISSLNRHEGKYSLRTRVRSNDADLDRALNVVYMLIDTLSSSLSRRQWEAIQAYEATGRQDLAASRMGLRSESTVSRTLKRGHYWQLLDAREEMSAILASWPAR